MEVELVRGILIDLLFIFVVRVGRGEAEGVTILVIICECHKYMTSKQLKKI